MRPAGINRLIVMFGLCLAVFAGSALSARVALADGLELLTRATKNYEAGAYSDASDLVDSAFKAGLTGELAARGILLRAQINEKNGELARALQDYSNALWMESLPPSERGKAKEGKERVMAAMGLSSSSTAASSAPSAMSQSASAGTSSSGGVLGFFGGIFGSGDAKPEAAPAPPPEPQRTWETSSASPVATSASPPQRRAVAAAAKPPAPPKVAKAVAPAPAPMRSAAVQASLQPVSNPVPDNAGGYLIVFGAVNNEVSARATAQGIKAKLADILVNRQLDLGARPGGGYLIQAGPYKAKSAALALCSAMKQRGVPCQVTP